MKQDLLTFKHFSNEDMQNLLELALDVKNAPEKYRHALSGRSVVALFEKPSSRTRVSFDIGINKLGGHLVYLDSQAGKLAGREDAKDMGANLACWADAIVARVFDHQTLEQMAQASKVPVINALCDMYHPCQALADFLTLKERFGQLKGLTLAYIGDGNNVTHSLMLVAAILGVNMIVITPQGYEPDAEIVEQAKARATENGVSLTVSHDLQHAEGADALYTDTWISMGNETPVELIKHTFAPYQLNQALMQKTGAKYVMHCQPAHRDLEITSELVDGNQSLLMQQAENRMHGQNAILISLLGPQSGNTLISGANHV